MQEKLSVTMLVMSSPVHIGLNGPQFLNVVLRVVVVSLIVKEPAQMVLQMSVPSVRAKFLTLLLVMNTLAHTGPIGLDGQNAVLSVILAQSLVSVSATTVTQAMTGVKVTLLS